MEISEKNAELFKAIALFQGKRNVVYKGGAVRDYSGRESFKYADFTDIIVAIQPNLTECELAHNVGVKNLKNQRVKVVTRITHAPSQEYISVSNIVPVIIPKSKDGKELMNYHQALAMAVTYVKKVTLCGLLGIITSDDKIFDSDNVHNLQAEADKRIDQEEKNARNKLNASNAVSMQAKLVTPPPIKEVSESERQNLLIKAVAYSLDSDGIGETVVNAALGHYGLPTLEQLNAMQLSKIIDRIEEEKAKHSASNIQ